MKLYHGSSYHFNAGDSLSVDKSSDATIYATNNIGMAIGRTNVTRVTVLKNDFNNIG